MIKKLGLVLECAREGADEKVLTCLTRRLAPATKLVSPACMVSKAHLITDGAAAAQKLLQADNCDRVFIVWDLKPEWQDEEQKLTCAEECALVSAELDRLNIRNRVDLICIVEMLETWVIADERAVTEYLSKAPRTHEFKRQKRPEIHPDPKALLITEFGKTSRRIYRDHTDAVRVIQKCPDVTRLRRVSSFARFVNKLTGSPETEFSRCGDACNDLARSGVFEPVQNSPATVAVPTLPRTYRPRGNPRKGQAL